MWNPEGAARRETRFRVVLGLGGALLAVSSAALFVRIAAPLDPRVIALLRVVTTGVVLGVVAPKSFVVACVTAGRSVRVALGVFGAGLLLAAHFASWFASLELTSVVVSVALVSTQPIFAAALGRILGDRASVHVYAGGLVAILGSALMVGAEANDPARSSILGPALALVGAVTAAGYFLIGRGLRATVPFSGYFGLVNIAAGACLAPWVLFSGVPLGPEGATTSDYLAVLYLGLVPGVIGHGLLNWAVRRVPVHVVSLASVLEPVGATLLAWLVLSEAPSQHAVAGAAILLAGVGVGLRNKS